jgi:hypothetical protein
LLARIGDSWGNFDSDSRKGSPSKDMRALFCMHVSKAM